MIKNVVRLLITSWETVDFDEILQAYLVDNKQQYLLIDLTKVHRHTTFSFWKKYNDDTHYVSRKIYNDDF